VISKSYYLKDTQLVSDEKGSIKYFAIESLKDSTLANMRTFDTYNIIQLPSTYVGQFKLLKKPIDVIIIKAYKVNKHVIRKCVKSHIHLAFSATDII